MNENLFSADSFFCKCLTFPFVGYNFYNEKGKVYMRTTNTRGFEQNIDEKEVFFDDKKMQSKKNKGECPAE